MTRNQTIERDAAPARRTSSSSIDRKAGLALDTEDLSPSRDASWSHVLFGAAVATILAAALRLALLEAPPLIDEIYHILAARSFVASGEFALADGAYERAWLYTRLVAAMFDTFGESLAAGRLPSVVFGSLLAGAIYAFVRLAAGRLSAVIAASFTIVWPEGIAISEFVRFYAAQGLAFVLAALVLYRLVERPVSRLGAVLLAVVAVALLALAAHLQPTTFIGVAGLSVWLGLFIVLPFVWTLSWRWLALAIIAFAGAAALAVAIRAGWLAEAWAMFRWVPIWAAANQDFEGYYHKVLLTEYPLFWTLTPLAVMIGVATRPRPVIMATTVFAVGFLLHSIGGMKSPRYLYYLMPFLFIVWGIAIAAVAQVAAGPLARAGRVALTRVLPFPLPMGAALAAVAVILAVLANPAIPLALRMAVPFTAPPEWDQARVNMGAARPALEQAVAEADLLLTGSELHTLYYFGRADIVLNASRQSEVEAGVEFVIDPRTGLQIVATAESVARIIDCTATGMFVTPTFQWMLGSPIRETVGSWSAGPLIPVELPESSDTVAFRWSHEPATGPRCESIPVGRAS